jgi:hypothetical protein
VYRDQTIGTVDGPDRGMENEAVKRLIVLISRWVRSQDDEARAEWLNYFRYNANEFFIVVKNHLQDDPEPDATFNQWEKRESLLGTEVEEYGK